MPSELRIFPCHLRPKWWFHSLQNI